MTVLVETAAQFVVTLLLPCVLLLLITSFYKGGNEDSEVKKVTCSEPHSPRRVALGIKPPNPKSSILPPRPLPCLWCPANHGGYHPLKARRPPGTDTPQRKTKSWLCSGGSRSSSGMWSALRVSRGVCRVRRGAGSRGGAGDVRGSEGVAGELRKAEMLTLARIYKALNAFPRRLLFHIQWEGIKSFKEQSFMLRPRPGKRELQGGAVGVGLKTRRADVGAD